MAWVIWLQMIPLQPDAVQSLGPQAYIREGATVEDVIGDLWKLRSPLHQF
jgi:hypothetical protein